MKIDSNVKKRSVINISQQIFNKNGFRGMFKGMGVSMFEVAPFIAIRMSCYDTLKTKYSPRIFTKE